MSTIHVGLRRQWARRGATLSTLVVLLVAASAGTARNAVAQDTVRTTRLIGRVLDSLGAPIRGADVAILPDLRRGAVTNDSGLFAIDSVPVGRVEIAVRRIGYTPAGFVAQLHAGIIGRVTMHITLAPAAVPELPRVETTDTLAHPWLTTFDRRRATDHGEYFTREDIVRSQVTTLSDFLRRVSGVSMSRTSLGRTQHVTFNSAQSTGRACPPQLFVHSMDYSGDVDDFHPDDIEAMEVYPTIASVPAELQTNRAQACGAIVIWTREPPPVSPKRKGGGDQ